MFMPKFQYILLVNTLNNTYLTDIQIKLFETMFGDQFQALRPNMSSLPLEIFAYFNWHYAVFLFFINIVLFTYKAITFYYPSDFLAWDLISVFLYLFVEYVRLFFISKGNKTSQIRPLAVSILLTIPITVLHAYYLDLQTYVLRVDIVLNAIALFFIACEALMSVHLFFTLMLAASKF